MERIEEIKERLSKIDPNMKLYKCDSYWMDKDVACGIYEGQSLDCSYDECHHPLSHDLADYIVNTPSDIRYLLSLIDRYKNATTVLLARTEGLINEYQMINRITDDSISLTKNIANEIKEFVSTSSLEKE